MPADGFGERELGIVAWRRRRSKFPQAPRPSTNFFSPDIVSHGTVTWADNGALSPLSTTDKCGERIE